MNSINKVRCSFSCMRTEHFQGRGGLGAREAMSEPQECMCLVWDKSAKKGGGNSSTWSTGKECKRERSSTGSLPQKTRHSKESIVHCKHQYGLVSHYFVWLHCSDSRDWQNYLEDSFRTSEKNVKSSTPARKGRKDFLIQMLKLLLRVIFFYLRNWVLQNL